MKKASVFEKFIKRLREDKKLEITVYAVILLSAVLIFLLTGGISCNSEGEAPESTHEPKNSISEEQLEQRLESILSTIDGAGRVRVMITFENTSELVTAMDSQVSVSGDSSSEDITPALVSSGNEESPIIISEKMPSIRGVIIVAEGAVNIRVRVDLQTAAQTVLGILPDRINVFTMQP